MDFATPVRAALQPVRVDTHPIEGVGRGTVLTIIGVAGAGAARFAASALIGRVGGPTVLGLTQSAMSLAQILCLVFPAPMGSAASKFVARSRGAGREAEAAGIAAYLANQLFWISILLAAAAAVLWALIDAPGPDVAVVAGLTWALTFYTFTRGLQYGTGQVMRATMWELVLGLIALPGVLALLLAGVRSTALLLPTVAGLLLYFAASWPRTPNRTPVAGKLRREIRIFVILGTAGTLVSAGFLQASVLVARLVGGLRLAGEFAAALTLATPLALFATSISLTLFPSMAAAWGRGDQEALRSQTDRATRLLIFVMVGVLGAAALLTTPVTRMVWGDSFVDVAAILPVLLLAMLMSTVAVPSVNSITSGTNRGMAVSAASSTLGLAVGIASWWILAKLDVQAALVVPFGYLLGVSVQTFIPVVLVWRRQNQQWAGAFLRALVGVLIVAGLIIGQSQLQFGQSVVVAAAVLFSAVWCLAHRSGVRAMASLVRQNRA